MRTREISQKDRTFTFDQATPPGKPSSLRTFYEWAFIYHKPTPTDFWNQLRNSAGPKTDLETRELLKAIDVSDFPKPGDTQKALTVFRFTLNKVQCEGSKQESNCTFAKYMLTYFVTSYDSQTSKY